MNKILISACLLGHKVRYDGGDQLSNHPYIKKWQQENRLISVCPEVLGGLSIPRAPAETMPNHSAKDVFDKKAQVLTIDQKDVTDEYVLGAKKALKSAKEHQIKIAILKANSPSCGNKMVYDGTFSNRKIKGMGLTAYLLEENGIKVFNETEINEAFDYLDSLEVLSTSHSA